jgi:predicted DNA-binding transcriptional regulator AlpA
MKKLLPWRALEDRLPISRRQVDRMVADGEFPQPYLIGKRKQAWSEQEINDWLAGRQKLASAK